MAPTNLPHPDDFVDIIPPEPGTKFPKHLPERPGKSKSYVGTLLRNNKFRIMVSVVCFFAMIGGTVISAILISRTMERINEGQVVLSTSSPLIVTTATSVSLRSTVTQTVVTTQTFLVTDRISMSTARLPSTTYAVATASPAPSIPCQAGDTGISCAGAVSGPK